MILLTNCKIKMKKYIALLLILVFYTTHSNDNIKKFQTNEIIVISEDKQIQKSTCISELEINSSDRNKYFTLDALLNEINGIHSTRNSKNEGYFRLRGIDQRQIGIFFDGIPIVNQYDGMVDLSLYSLTAASKVSVSKGLSSSLYGANNLGGSINIITDNVFNNNTINAQLNFGDLSKNIGLKVKQKFGNLYITFVGDYNNFDNFNSSYKLETANPTIKNSYSKSYSGFLKVANQLGNTFLHSLSVMYGRGEKGIPVNMQTTKPRFWKMPEWNNILTSYGTYTELTNGVLLKTNIYATNSRNVIDSYDDSTYTTQQSKSAFHSIQEYYKFGGLAILEINWEKFEQTKFAFSLIRDFQNQQANISDPWKEFRSQVLSISAEQNFAFGNFGGLIGTNYDLLTPLYANSATLRKAEDFLNYQLGLHYTINNFNIYSNYSHKSRFPTLKEFYAEVIGANKPNPDLNSEFADNYELGVRTNLFDNLNIRTSLYANYVKNLIDITVIKDNTRQFINVGKVLFTGLELELIYTIFDFVIKYGLNYQKSENQTEGASTKTMPLRPEYISDFAISRYFDFGLNAEIQLQSYYNQKAFNSDKKTYFDLPNYNLLNVYLSYKVLKNISMNATFFNIFDELYYSDWGYPQYGFNFNFGVGINF